MTRTTHRFALLLAACLMPLFSGLVFADPEKTPELPPDKPREKQKDQPQKPDKSQKAYDLRPKFVAGRESRFIMKSESSSVTEPLKKNKKNATTSKSESSMQLEIELRLRTTSVEEDGSAELELVYESYKLKSTGATELEFDSDRPPAGGDDSGGTEGMINSLLDGIVGTTLTLHADADGNISSITGGEALALLGGSDGAGAALASTNWIAAAASEGNAGARRIGERWANRDELGGGSPLGDFDMITTHTFKRVRGDVAEVEFVTAMETAASGGKQRDARQLDSAGGKGKYLWDLERGELQELTSEQTSVIESGSGDEATKMTSTQKVHVKRR